MGWNKRRSTVLAVGVAALLLGAASRLERGRSAGTPPRPARPKPHAEFAHPIIPSQPVVRPAEAPCRGRDLHAVVSAIRASTRQLPAALDKAAPAGERTACRATDDSRRWSALVDLYTRDANSCVARDSELDSQWNQVQSAVLALDGCVDCTRLRAARAISCARMTQLLDAAEKATP